MSIILNEIDIRLSELESAGGSISDSQMVQYIHDALSGDPLRDSFWFNCKGAMNMAKLSSYTVETAGKYIVQFWYSYKPRRIVEVANFTKEKGKRNFEKRFCQNCKDGKRNRIMLTHNTKDCRIAKENVSGEEQSNRIEIDNKQLSNYSTPLFHDSGTSKTMLNYKTKVVLEDNLTILSLQLERIKNLN